MCDSGDTAGCLMSGVAELPPAPKGRRPKPCARRGPDGEQLGRPGGGDLRDQREIKG